MYYEPTLKLPTVTVVIPAWNEADHIADTLRAILAQTYQPLEIIVVDNNSTDDTARIANSFRGVKVILETRQGIEFARSRGYDAARGEVIARTDADTRPDPVWLERMVEVFSATDADALTGPIYYYDMPARHAVRNIEKAIRGTLAHFTKDTRFLAGANMGMRRIAWRKIRKEVCYVHSYHEDLDLGIHLHKAGFQVGFVRDMHVATSARRMSGPTREFKAYIKRFEHTFHAHGIFSPAIKVPIMIYLPCQPILRVIRHAYNADTQRISLRKLVSNFIAS